MRLNPRTPEFHRRHAASHRLDRTDDVFVAALNAHASCKTSQITRIKRSEQPIRETFRSEKAKGFCAFSGAQIVRHYTHGISIQISSENYPECSTAGIT